MPIVNLLYSGPEEVGEQEEDQCIKAEAAEVGLSESTCGNGNSDLYKALLAIIYGQEIPTTSQTSGYSATIWAQDQIGNGYEVDIAVGRLSVEKSVTEQNTELFNISPQKIINGEFDLDEETGWIIDKIWSASWAGYVTDDQDKSISYPNLTISGSVIKLSPPDGVYGCLKIKYDLTRDKISVTNEGEEEGLDPYTTSLVFNVDGCDEEQLLALPSHSCLVEELGHPWDDDPPWKEEPPGVTVEDPPPEEEPNNTESVYDFCSRKLIRSDLPDAPEYLGITKGLCD